MPVDVYEDEESFHVRFEVPGVKREDLKLEAEGGVLTVSFERKSEAEGRSESLKSSRAVRLPDGADFDRSSAKLEDGVLTVTFAKHEAKKPRAIQIG
jgi:HSP20 family protein